MLSQHGPNWDRSWNSLSEGWPEIKFNDIMDTKLAYALCVRYHVVPYGSYVCVDDHTIRVETETQKKQLWHEVTALKQFLQPS